MASLQMQGDRTDRRRGYVRVQVDPILDGSFRVTVGVNDHYAVADEDSSRSTPEIASIIRERWFESERQADAIVESLLGVAA
jgi:hypothetical protein